MVMVVLRAAVLIAGLFTLMLFALLLGLVMDPFFTEVLGNETIQALGWDQGIETAQWIGLGLVLPLLGLALLIWAITAELQHDVGQRRMR